MIFDADLQKISFTAEIDAAKNFTPPKQTFMTLLFSLEEMEDEIFEEREFPERTFDFLIYTNS